MGRMLALAALAVAVLACALPSPAGEPAKDKARAERIAQVTAKVKEYEQTLRECTPEKIAAERKTGEPRGSTTWRDMERGANRARTELPGFKAELAWLKGELTSAKAEAAVKASEESLAKAPEAGKAEAQAAVDAARKALEIVKALEAKAEF